MYAFNCFQDYKESGFTDFDKFLLINFNNQLKLFQIKRFLEL